MEKIARSGDAHIRFYWDLAVPTADCPNWIARWFLYHVAKFLPFSKRAESLRIVSQGAEIFYLSNLGLRDGCGTPDSS